LAVFDGVSCLPLLNVAGEELVEASLGRDFNKQPRC